MDNDNPDLKAGPPAWSNRSEKVRDQMLTAQRAEHRLAKILVLATFAETPLKIGVGKEVVLSSKEDFLVRVLEGLGYFMVPASQQKLEKIENSEIDFAKTDEVVFNRDYSYDLRLSRQLIAELRKLGIFGSLKLDTIELKTETYQWERYGNLCVEIACDGHATGLERTKANTWVHELKRDSGTVGYFLFPVVRLKQLRVEWCAKGIARVHRGGGDGGRFDNFLIPIKELLR